MWPRRIFRVLNKLFGNFAKLCTSGPHFATKIKKICSQNAQISRSDPENSENFEIRHKKMVEKSNFGEKLPNFLMCTSIFLPKCTK